MSHLPLDTQPVPPVQKHKEKGYPWFFVHWHPAYLISLAIFLTMLFGLLGFYFWYMMRATEFGLGGKTFWPGNPLGLGYGIVGLLFMLLALGQYSIRRRMPRRKIGQLNAVLSWHKFFGLLTLAALLVHSFGNLSWQKSGDYALYGLLAVCLSGLCGRVFDRLLPRFIAEDVRQSLTAEGEKRVDVALEQRKSLQSEEKKAPAGTSLLPMAKAQIHILRQEHVYYTILRGWRAVHVGLVFVTMGCVIWHLIYAITLLWL